MLTIKLTHLQYILVEVIMSAPLIVTNEFAVPYVGCSSISLGAAATEALCMANNTSSAMRDKSQQDIIDNTDDHEGSELVLCRSTKRGGHHVACATILPFQGAIWLARS
jgi:hypothetical protein